MTSAARPRKGLLTLGLVRALPWHPLIVHVGVVIGPLTALAYAWTNRTWRVRLAWPLLAARRESPLTHRARGVPP